MEGKICLLSAGFVVAIAVNFMHRPPVCG